jgi:hypothetical protein
MHFFARGYDIRALRGPGSIFVKEKIDSVEQNWRYKQNKIEYFTLFYALYVGHFVPFLFDYISLEEY